VPVNFMYFRTNNSEEIRIRPILSCKIRVQRRF
jgi:hypothetical protein